MKKSKRYLYDANDVLQGVFEDENALHRYLNKEYPFKERGAKKASENVLPSVYRIERRLMHKDYSFSKLEVA